MKEYINEELTKYIAEQKYPWHMPGHKRRDCFKSDGFWLDKKAADRISSETMTDRWGQMFAYDFTEAKDLDDMHKPESFIKKCLEELRTVYGTHQTYMLVNGATGGILAAIHACCKQGDYILMARNCHKSVYNGVSLLQLHPEYLLPEITEDTGIFLDIKPEMVRQRINCMVQAGKKPAALLLTSPTYEGVLSDITEISRISNQYDIPLIVDAAHGAHLAFMGENYPLSAVKCGADIVIESAHKTLPSLTQTALLHVMNPKYSSRLERYLGIFQTSSPSYLFMQSLEKAVCYCQSAKAEFEAYLRHLQEFRKGCQKFKKLILFEPGQKVYAYDIGKLVFQISPSSFITYQNKKQPLTGMLLLELLAEEYGQICEMAAADYVIAMTSVMDSPQAFDNLFHALQEIDERIVADTSRSSINMDLQADADGIDTESKTDADRSGIDYHLFAHIPELRMLPGEAWNSDSYLLELALAEGFIAGEYVYAYPPGIPVVVPGEVISAEVIKNVHYMLKQQLNVAGVYQSFRKDNTKKNEIEKIRITVVGGEK